MSVRLIADASNCYTGTASEATMIKSSESGDKRVSLSTARMNGVYGFIHHQPNKEAHAVIVPGGINPKPSSR